MNTSKAEQLVADAKKEIPNLATQYAGKWDDLFSPLAKLFIKACETIEREASPLIGPLYAEIRDVYRDFENRVRARFDKVCDEALLNLKANIRIGYFSLRNMNESLRNQMREVERTTPELEREVRRQKVVLAGHEGDIEVPAGENDRRDTWALWVRAAIIVLAVTIEYWAGFATWADISSLNAATWLSFLFIGGTAFGGWVGVHYKRYRSSLDRERNFKTHFPNGHSEGFVVEPVQTTEKFAALGGMWIVAVMLLAFSVSRIYVILQGRDNFVFYAGSFLLLVIFVASPVVSIILTRPYPKRQYDALGQAQANFEQARADLGGIKRQLGDGRKTFQVSSDAAYQIYKETVAASRQQALADVRAMNEKRLELVKLLRQHEANIAVIIAGFPESCNILVQKVDEEFRLVDQEAPFRDPDFEADIKGRLNGHRTHRWQEPGLTLRDLQGKEFVVSLSADGLADLRLVEAEVRMSLPKWKMGMLDEPAAEAEEASHVTV